MPPIAFRGYVDAIPTVDYGAQPAPSGPTVVVHQPAKLSREDRARLQDESTEFLRSDVVSLLVQLLKADAAAAPGCDDTAVVLTSYESNNIEDLIKGGVSDRAIALNAASEKEWGRATRLVLPVNRGNLHWYCMSVPIDPADAGDIIVYDSLIRAGQSPPAQDAEYARWCTYARAFVCAMNVRYGTRHAVPERYSVCRGPLQTDGYTCGLMAFFAMRYFVMAKPMPKLPADDRAAGPTLKRIARVELGRIEKKRPQPPQEAIRALVLAGRIGPQSRGGRGARVNSGVDGGASVDGQFECAWVANPKSI